MSRRTQARIPPKELTVNKTRFRRFAAAAGLATSLVVAFAALGGVSMAQSAIGAAQYQYGGKATICHKGKTLSVGKPAEAAHIRHGDTTGACAGAAAQKAKKAKAAKAAAAKAKAEQRKAEKQPQAKGGKG
jgi:hypothetical protein